MSTPNTIGWQVCDMFSSPNGSMDSYSGTACDAMTNSFNCIAGKNCYVYSEIQQGDSSCIPRTSPIPGPDPPTTSTTTTPSPTTITSYSPTITHTSTSTPTSTSIPTTTTTTTNTTTISPSPTPATKNNQLKVGLDEQSSSTPTSLLFKLIETYYIGIIALIILFILSSSMCILL